MKIYVSWITYTPSSSVKIKLSIDKMVEYNEDELVKLFNRNVRRIYEISPTAHKNPDLIQLELSDGRRIIY